MNDFVKIPEQYLKDGVAFVRLSDISAIQNTSYNIWDIHLNGTKITLRDTKEEDIIRLLHLQSI